MANGKIIDLVNNLNPITIQCSFDGRGATSWTVTDSILVNVGGTESIELSLESAQKGTNETITVTIPAERVFLQV